MPELTLLNVRFLSGCAAGMGTLSVVVDGGLQLHFECTRFACLRCRHVEHCETGRPFFFTSNNGLSVCLHDEDR